MTDQDGPLQLIFKFPLTFTNPVVSFAFRAGIVRVLSIQASFTVDTTVVAPVEQLTLTGGTLVPRPLDACQRLAERLADAERALYEAQQAAPFNPEAASTVHALELALGDLQDLYQKECGSGSSSGPSRRFQIGR